MGTHLVLHLTDARVDTHASHLCRLVDALEAWGHVDRDAWTVETPLRDHRDRDFERALGEAEQRTKRRFGEPTNAAGVRDLLDAMGTTAGLRLSVPSPITHLFIDTSEQRLQRCGGLSDQARSVGARMWGDLEIDMHKVGRRYFEGAGIESEAEPRLLAEARAARSFGDELRLLEEADALGDRLLDERRLLMLDLFTALASRFEPASVKAYLDFDDYIPPRATMAYYRDGAAVSADLALLADADALHAEEHGWAYILYALGRVPSAEDARPMPEAETRALRERLRAITPDEVARVAAAMTAWVTPVAGGWLVANPDFDPVSGIIAPFFEALIAG